MAEEAQVVARVLNLGYERGLRARTPDSMARFAGRLLLLLR